MATYDEIKDQTLRAHNDAMEAFLGVHLKEQDEDSSTTEELEGELEEMIRDAFHEAIWELLAEQGSWPPPGPKVSYESDARVGEQLELPFPDGNQGG